MTPMAVYQICSSSILSIHLQDIAFKIVNREWEYSHRHGFRCQFNNSIFQLWFRFKRYRYRRWPVSNEAYGWFKNVVGTRRLQVQTLSSTPSKANPLGFFTRICTQSNKVQHQMVSQHPNCWILIMVVYLIPVKYGEFTYPTKYDVGF